MTACNLATGLGLGCHRVSHFLVITTYHKLKDYLDGLDRNCTKYFNGETLTYEINYTNVARWRQSKESREMTFG